MEWSLGGFPDPVIWELYAATAVDAVPICFAGRDQRDDTGETVAVEVVMRGRQKVIDTGEGKQGRRHRVENLRGLHLFPADDGR